jgi:hypothetical protein
MGHRSTATLLLLLAAFTSLELNSCARPRVGPKLIQADGASYVACNGVLWLEDVKIPKGYPSTYNVLYRDVQGVNHQLRDVRALRITDLPADTPACQNSASTKRNEAAPQTDPTLRGR